ncbi:COP9 signalosome complex subunit 7a [Sparassis crispa]|uniref:COP9 signalosome complex subunit 7a n=1 Tax=Sparassis crispa TaxID=139825 RepID=A0A401G8P2_9APHY|nr:COP9 signalosome complex subunit 7a [Sparassis crispa]GBE78546.1 COP9 signalosome complex subunit 7a [Sparassis crispa]
MDLGSHSTAKLEPFLLMSKSAKGAAAAKLIQDVTSAHGVFVFAELLDLPNIRELASSEQHSPSYSLLQLFSYKTYPDYLQHKDSLPALNQAQITKLKHLTLVSLAMESRILPYSQLLEVLQMPTIRELEDLIIDAIYLEIIRGKLDQKEQQFEVEYTMGRDLEPGKIERLLTSLQNWASTTSAVLATLDEKLVSMAADVAEKKRTNEFYEQSYQTNLKEILDKQKEIKAGLRAAAYPGRTGLTAAGIAERDRERERERREREREKEQDRENNSMDVDEPTESKGKNRKAPQQDSAQRTQRKRNRV